MKIRPYLLAGPICLCACPLSAATVTAVSNFGQRYVNTHTIGKAFDSDLQEASSFTTGPSGAELSSITLYGSGLGNVSGFTVALYTGITTAGPTGLVATLVGNSSPPSVDAAYSYSPAMPVILAANSTYWLVASAPNTATNSGFAWRATLSLDEDPGGDSGWSIGHTPWVTLNGGASWFVSGSGLAQFSVQVNIRAPAITVQPTSQFAVVGGNVTLSVTTTGFPAPALEWRKDGVALPGATASTLNLNTVSKSSAGSYSVVASNSVGSVTSVAAMVDIAVAAVSNLGQPFENSTGATKDIQEAISFTTGGSTADLLGVTLYGFGYGGPLSGFTVALYTGINTGGPTGLVTTFVGEASPVFLSNYIYRAPARLTLSPNSTYWLVISAPTTVGPSGFSWRSTLSAAEDAGAFSGWSIGNTRWVTSNGGASWFASGGLVPQFQVMTTEPALAITIQPTPQRVIAGNNVTLSVTANGNPAPAFQWRKDGVALPGASSSNLVLSSVSKSNAGSYSVVVSNSTGSVTSVAAVIDVIPASSLSNLSVRTTMSTGQVLIVGAVVSGGAKTILVRAAGPALNNFNLPGMVDPRLDLFTTGTLATATNDDWPAALSATFASVGAFPFASASKDAALSQSLNGSFTVQARGTGAGTLLVEAYDVLGGVSPRLINLSARNRVGTGSDVLIAGITLAGTGSKQLLIRAIGPGLAALGVSGTLVDPRLQVFNASGIVIGTNNNWDATLSPAFTQVGAFSLPANSLDSALLVSLDAGASYTMQVSGADGGTGEALIEVYEIF